MLAFILRIYQFILQLHYINLVPAIPLSIRYEINNVIKRMNEKKTTDVIHLNCFELNVLIS